MAAQSPHEDDFHKFSTQSIVRLSRNNSSKMLSFISNQIIESFEGKSTLRFRIISEKPKISTYFSGTSFMSSAINN